MDFVVPDFKNRSFGRAQLYEWRFTGCHFDYRTAQWPNVSLSEKMVWKFKNRTQNLWNEIFRVNRLKSVTFLSEFWSNIKSNQIYRCPVTTLTLVNDFWRHVLQRSREGLGTRTQSSQSLRHSKIWYFDNTAVRIDQHIVTCLAKNWKLNVTFTDRIRGMLLIQKYFNFYIFMRNIGLNFIDSQM